MARVLEPSAPGEAHDRLRRVERLEPGEQRREATAHADVLHRRRGLDDLRPGALQVQLLPGRRGSPLPPPSGLLRPRLPRLSFDALHRVQDGDGHAPTPGPEALEDRRQGSRVVREKDRPGALPDEGRSQLGELAEEEVERLVGSQGADLPEDRRRLARRPSGEAPGPPWPP
ncbi:MAG: hypothetical protein O7J95_19145 [Planctomycetota bacterium]|nr:hypothetical protein [Planctomycetota bacterium]